MNRKKILAAVAATGLVVVGVFGSSARAYVINSYSAKWPNGSIVYYLNPQNGDLATASVEAAVQSGAMAWKTQTTASVSPVYGGRVNDTTTGYDNRNVTIFRNTSNGGPIATTYWWVSGGSLVDADIIFWDADFTFFTGTSGCSGGFYVEDIMAHEFGHALGLSHSADATATMYPTVNWCATGNRSLSPDDIAGIQALYPPSSNTNTAPTVTIASPANGATVSDGVAVSFSGSANNQQQGNLTSQLTWSSDRVGYLGSGGAFSSVLPLGSNVVTASATDSGGLVGSKQVILTVAAPPPTGTNSATLTAATSKAGRWVKANLNWSGLTGSSVNLYRNNVKLTSTANDGSYADTLKHKGTYTYQVCIAAACSNTATVTY